MDLTPMVSKEISDFGKEARAGSGDQNFQNYSQGNQNALGLMKDEGSFDSGLGYQNPELSAIKAKYGSQVSRETQRLNLNTLRQGQEDQLRKIQVANQMAAEEIEINRQKEALRHQRKLMKKAARGQAIGNILGIVGAGAGMAMGGEGGRAAGGMVGFSIGQGVGNIAGQGGI